MIRPVAAPRSAGLAALFWVATTTFSAGALSNPSATLASPGYSSNGVRPAATTGPTAGAVSVLDARYGLTGDASRDPDDTAAFSAAIADAASGPVRYPAGPSGDPQAVVYVPPGSYRLNGLAVPSNVRLEIDAGAVLEPIARPSTVPVGSPVQLLLLGTHDITVPVVNVSVVAVGNVDNDLKQRAEPTYDGWDIDSYFSVDLDPDDTGASNDYAFLTLIDVSQFLVSDVYVVQNNTIPYCTRTTDAACPVDRGPYPGPTSARSAFVFKPSNQSGPAPGGPFFDPTDGTLSGVYSFHGPYGFGPTQIASGHRLTFDNLYSDGGTTLRFETDDTTRYHGGQVQTVHADHIVGQNCNRVVSLAAHKQVNSDVHLTDVTAVNCNNALVQSADSARRSGSFLGSTIDGLTAVGGPSAQVPDRTNSGLWESGTSVQAINVHPGSLDWSANVTGFSCSGVFKQHSSRVTIDGQYRSTPPPCSH